MKLFALMLCRNESWAIGASLRTALRWCDGAVVLMDRCIDDTKAIVLRIRDESRKPMYVGETIPKEHWMEMDERERTLTLGRMMGGTHFAIVDADEMLTANLFDDARTWFEELQPAEVLELPRISPVTLDSYWADEHEHATGGITLGFRDRPDLAWKPRGDIKYHFHGRPPRGSFAESPKVPLGRNRLAGGVMHLQYANRERMRAKALWYALNETVRWPHRKTPRELAFIYTQMLDKPNLTKPIPSEWWTEDKTHVVIESGPSWHLGEIKSFISKYGGAVIEEFRSTTLKQEIDSLGL